MASHARWKDLALFQQQNIIGIHRRTFLPRHNSHQACCRSQDWDSSITNFVRQGELRPALSLYQQLRKNEFLSLKSFTFVALLKACSKTKDLDQGCRIHSDIRRRGLLDTDGFIGSTLVDMYAKCGCLKRAQQIFNNLPSRDVVVWTALIAGYAEHGNSEHALHCFQQMQLDGIPPDPVLFVGALKACSNMGEIIKGQEMHNEIVQKGFDKDLFLGSSLVDMYAKCRCLPEAQEVFHGLPFHDVVTWTALIAGYVEHGHGQRAIEIFEKMKLDGISPGIVAFVSICKACSCIGCPQKGLEFHTEATLAGLDTNPVVGCSVVDMYAKVGSLVEAQGVFETLQERDVVPWTALITGYVEHGRSGEALLYFEQMQLEGITSDPTIYLSCLKASGSIGATVKGCGIHVELTKRGWESELFASSSLVDMYAKCGSLENAEAVFQKLPVQDVVSWTALITGYAQLGKSEHVFHTVDRMIEIGAKPDVITLMSVLNVCSQTGQVELGRLYFEAFCSEYGVVPTLEHYNCIIDLLCRSGYIEEAVRVVKKMPFHPRIVVWHTILGACRKWHNVELGRHAFECALRLDEKDVSIYVCMSNIYVDASMEAAAKEVEALRIKNQAE